MDKNPDDKQIILLLAQCKYMNSALWRTKKNKKLGLIAAWYDVLKPFGQIFTADLFWQP